MNSRVLSAALTGASFFALQSTALAGQAPAANPSSFPEQVVITASPLTNDPNAIASTVGSVDRAKILELGGANIADVLKDLPGVSATTFASGASRPVIRGFDASRVRILEDGIGTFDVSDIGPDHAVPTGPLGTERVEVVRGAATVRYGSQAIGGVVNAINNRIPFGLPDAPISGEAAGGYSTGNKAGDGSVLLDGRADQFAFHADGYIRSTGDYDIPGGTQANSYFKGDGASVGGSYFFGDSRVGAAVIHYDANYGIPSDITHIKMRQTKELVGSSFDIGLGPLKTITVDGGYGDYKHDEIDPDGNVLDTFIDKEWDTRAESLFGQMGPFSSSAFGIQLQRRDFSALGDARAFLEPTLTRSEAGFAFTELPISDIFKLQFGARVEQDDIKGTPAGDVSQVKRSFTPASGSTSLVYNPAPMVTLGLTVSTAGRAPNVVELFAHGPHDGPGTFETGNPDLKIERANSVEGNVRVNMADVQLDASLWGVSFDNYIHGQLTGALCSEDGDCTDPDGEFKQLNYTQGGARFWGIEGKAAKSLLTTNAGVLVGDIHADYVRATLKEGGDVPLIPPYRVGGGLGWQSDMVDADIHLTYTGPQHRTGAALSATGGFVDLHLGATWRPMGYLPGLSLSAFADNLTDAKQRNAVALNRDVVMLPGRTFRLVARYAF